VDIKSVDGFIHRVDAVIPGTAIEGFDPFCGFCVKADGPT
jgi:hypothetical protein